MAKTKKVFKFFTIYDYVEEQEFLSKMHSEGWRLTKVWLPGVYCFEECEPERVIYQLDYNKDKEQDSYIQMFADCGWEYLFDFVGYSYFRKPENEMNGEEEIFNDDSSKQDMIRRVFKGRMIPMMIIFALIICPNIICNYVKHEYTMMAIFVILFLLYVGIFTKSIFMYRQLERK